MSASIARFLKDFGEPEAPATPAAQSFESSFPALDDFSGGDFPEMPAEPVLDMEELRAAAIEEGRGLERAELTERFDAERRELVEAHDQALKGEQARVEREVAQRLADQLKQNIEQIVTLFTEQALAALSPVLTEELSSQAAVDLAALVRQSLVDGDASKLVIRGPRSMFDAFIAELELAEAQYQFIESDDYDLTVEMDESIVVTRMSAWASSLRKVMQ